MIYSWKPGKFYVFVVFVIFFLFLKNIKAGQFISKRWKIAISHTKVLILITPQTSLVYGAAVWAINQYCMICWALYEHPHYIPLSQVVIMLHCYCMSCHSLCRAFQLFIFHLWEFCVCGKSREIYCVYVAIGKRTIDACIVCVTMKYVFVLLII